MCYPRATNKDTYNNLTQDNTIKTISVSAGFKIAAVAGCGRPGVEGGRGGATRCCEWESLSFLYSNVCKMMGLQESARMKRIMKKWVN